jgi:hypothetical protein
MLLREVMYVDRNLLASAVPGNDKTFKTVAGMRSASVA